jgi:hypothetical protein
LERTSAQGGVTSRSLVCGNLIFGIAQREDDADIRRLLRENALGGWIRLSLEREPDSFAADLGLSRSHAFLLARARDSGEAVGICERSVRDAFVGGNVARLPYLGSLRVAPAYRHRIRVLRGGFASVRTLLDDPADLPFALTSITANNEAARRVLCAGLPGLPTYRPVGELSTFAIRTRVMAIPPGVEHATSNDIPAIAVLLQRCYRRFQYSPVWRACDLERVIATGGLRVEDFLVVRHGPGVRACLAVWDQGSVRQAVVRAYAPWLARLRPLINFIAPVAAMPSLPPPASPLRQVYLSHIAVEDDDPAMFRRLLVAGLALARRRGFEVALAGFASEHPFAAVLRRQRTAIYRSLLQLVHWPEAQPMVGTIPPRIPHPEIAIM